MGDVIIDGLTGANRLVILDANGKIPALDGSAVTAIAGANFSSGTIPVARIDTGTTAGKIVKLDGNAKLPAVSGAALTGVAGATKNASDPTISTNPSGGVGTEWQNTTSGEVFVCTDATAGENVWKNVGDQSGDIQPYQYQGTAYGYTKGGSGVNNKIDRYSYTSDANATDHADLAVSRSAANCTHHSTHSYTFGGSSAGGGTPTNKNSIEKYAFASSASAAQTAVLTFNKGFGSTSCNNSYGFMVGHSMVIVLMVILQTLILLINIVLRQTEMLQT